MSQSHGERFEEYLKRVMLYAAPIVTPKDVAWFLASYARDAKIRVEEAGDLPALTGVRTALEEALGLKFEGERANISSAPPWYKPCSMGSFPPGCCGAAAICQRARHSSCGSSPPTTCGSPSCANFFYTLAEPGQLDILNLPGARMGWSCP